MTRGAPYRLSIVVSLSLMLMACSNPERSAEYKALDAEVASLETEISDIESSINDRKSDASQLSLLKDERQSLISQFFEILSDSSKRQRIIRELGVPACKQFQIATYQASGVVDGFGDDFWDSVYIRVSPADLIFTGPFFSDEQEDGDPDSLMQYSVDVMKTGCIEKGDREFYTQCETVDKRIINKNPEAFRGKCIKGTVRIAQFDSNTGPCAFQGYLGGGFDVRAQFGETLDPDTHASVTDCEWTKELVEDNFITFWGWGLGAYSYTTTNGGNQTVPAFKMFRYQRG